MLGELRGPGGLWDTTSPINPPGRVHLHGGNPHPAFSLVVERVITQ